MNSDRLSRWWHIGASNIRYIKRYVNGMMGNFRLAGVYYSLVHTFGNMGHGWWKITSRLLLY